MSTRTLKTTISIKVPSQDRREGLLRLEQTRRRNAVAAATKAFCDVMEDWGIEGDVTYTSSYSSDIDKYTKVNVGQGERQRQGE